MPIPPEYNLPLDEFYQQTESLMDEEDRKFAMECAVLFKAMWRGTLTTDGQITPKTVILQYRFKRMLQICQDYVDGKIEQLPKKLW